MLHDFINANRSELASRIDAKVSSRPWPSATTAEQHGGIPLFLTQLCETLLRDSGTVPRRDGEIGVTAAQHGRDLLAKGYTVSQVVHDYGDVCQAVTELATDKRATISPEEFHTLNRCLDTAIAEAVTEYSRLRDHATSLLEIERLGHLAHELRNGIQTALLSFGALKSGRVGITGSTGAVLGRSLIGLRDLIDRTVSEARLAASERSQERVSLLEFVDEVAVAANLHAQYRGMRFTVERVDPALAIEVDSQLLATALMNLLQNAFKYSHANGQITLRTRGEADRILIEVEDECGGTGMDGTGPQRAFGDRRGTDRSGLGLGLSIARRAARANGGEIHHRTLAGKGCIFTIELPRAPPPGPC